MDETRDDSYEMKTFPTHDGSFVGGDSSSDCSSKHESSTEEPDDALLAMKRMRKAHDPSYDRKEERVILKKLDRNLVLFLALLYMLSFLDRSNIGNAKIAGLTADLQLSSSQYEWLLTAFYITYIVFEWMTMLYRIVPAHIYIALCVLSWGFVASLQSVAGSFTIMFCLRALLGISEAAFGPGVPFYLSFFFKREELAFRTGLFISAAPLATSFASSLAWLIIKLGEGGPIAPWRLLFLLEGFPSMIVAVFAWLYIPDGPGTARYLNSREKKVAQWRLLEKDGRSRGGKGDAKPRLRLREIGLALADPKCYMTALMFFGCNVAFSSLPPFLPTIINEMNYSPVTSQILSAPPYIFSFLVVVISAYHSDRRRNRGHFILFHAIVAGIGYFVIAAAGFLRANSLWRYAGVFLASAGFFSAVTLIITWTVNNQDTASRRGTGVAMLNVIGQLGPLLGTRLYPDSDKPYYVRGMSVCGGFMLLVGILALVLRYILARKNLRRKDSIAYRRIEQDGDQAREGEYLEEHQGSTQENGDSPFIFML